MPSKVLQQVAAGIHRIVYIKSLDRAGAAGNHSFRLRQHDRRPVIGFNQPGGDNTNDPFVPFGMIQHGAFSLSYFRIVMHHFQRDGRSTGIQGFALGVEFIDLVAQVKSLFRIVGNQQFHRVPGAFDPAGGIDAGADNKNQIVDRQLAGIPVIRS